MLGNVENLLSGAIRSATAQVIIGTMNKCENVSLNQVYKIIDKTTQVVEYSRMLDTKSTELEETSSQLHRANTQLKAFDYLKDEFFQLSHMNSTPPPYINQSV